MVDEESVETAFENIEAHIFPVGKMLMDGETLKSFEDTTAPGIRKVAIRVPDDEDPSRGWWEVPPSGKSLGRRSRIRGPLF